MEALATVHNSEVEKQIHIKTHSVLRLELTRNPFKGKRTFQRKLGSLKGCVDAEIREAIKDLDPKDAHQKRKDAVEDLKKIMDRKFSEQEVKLEEPRAKGDAERFWHMWSFAAESAYLEHLDLTDDVKKKTKRQR